MEALHRRDAGLALQLARGLLQANPADPFPHFVMASAHAQMGQPGPARRSAAQAFRFADASPDKFQAAQLASRMALQEKRPTLAQIWLRRTAIHAPNDQVLDQVAKDYRLLRQINPWAFRLRGALRPSSNVNNGADTALQIIDGVPVIGYLSGSAQSLSGVIGTVDVSVFYRLQGTQSSKTTLGGRVYVQRVALSDSAKEQAPDVSGSDFASTFAEFQANHLWAVGPANRGGTAELGLNLGENWYGGARNFRFVRLSGGRSWQVSPRNRLRFRLSGEKRSKARSATYDAHILSGEAHFMRGMANGNRLNISAAFRDSDAAEANGTFKSASVRVGYDFGRPIGPVRLGAALTLGYSDYPKFWHPVIRWHPGGRQDQSAYVDVNMFFSDWDYAGFAPVLRLRAGRKTSTDTRFSSREFSVSLGVESTF